MCIRQGTESAGGPQKRGMDGWAGSVGEGGGGGGEWAGVPRTGEIISDRVRIIT